jgi:micrococcal nuclease
MRKFKLFFVIGLLGVVSVFAVVWLATTNVPAGPSTERADLVSDDEGDVSPDEDDVLSEDEEDGDIAKETDGVETNAYVIRAVDGDTLDVRLDDGGEARVRLLGVNTPETVDPRKPVECFGNEASAFTKHALNGKRVLLEADPSADERDKYGRLLRNVILEDGTDFNAELVARGYAQAYTFFPLDPLRKREIIRLQNEAREAGRGMWSEESCGE